MYTRIVKILRFANVGRLLRDAKLFDAKLGQIDGAGNTGSYLIQLVEAKPVEAKPVEAKPAKPAEVQHKPDDKQDKEDATDASARKETSNSSQKDS